MYCHVACAMSVCFTFSVMLLYDYLHHVTCIVILIIICAVYCHVDYHLFHVALLPPSCIVMLINICVMSHSFTISVMNSHGDYDLCHVYVYVYVMFYQHIVMLMSQFVMCKNLYFILFCHIW